MYTTARANDHQCCFQRPVCRAPLRWLPGLARVSPTFVWIGWQEPQDVCAAAVGAGGLLSTMGGPVSGPLPQAWPSAPDEAGCGVLGEAERCGRGGGRGMGGEMGHSRGYCTAVPQAPRSRRGAAPAGRGLSSPGAVGQWPGIGVWGWRVSRAGGRQGWWEPSVACGVVLYNDWRWGGACCSPSGQWPLRWRCYKNEGGGGHAAGDGAGPAWDARRWWDGPWNCNAVLLGLFVCTDRPGRGARRAPPRRARR